MEVGARHTEMLPNLTGLLSSFRIPLPNSSPGRAGHSHLQGVTAPGSVQLSVLCLPAQPPAYCGQAQKY